MKLKNGRKNFFKRFKIWNKKYICDFQQNETIRSFGKSIYTRKAKIFESEKDQSNLLQNIIEFNNKSRPRTTEGKN